MQLFTQEFGSLGRIQEFALQGAGRSLSPPLPTLPTLFLGNRFPREPARGSKKVKGSPDSSTERKVAELIPVLCRQPAGARRVWAPENEFGAV